MNIDVAGNSKIREKPENDLQKKSLVVNWVHTNK